MEIDLFKVCDELERATSHLKKSVKVAILGCVVNGPGEAADADIGIAAGQGVGILYRKGEVVRRIREDEIVAVLLEEINNFVPAP